MCIRDRFRSYLKEPPRLPKRNFSIPIKYQEKNYCDYTNSSIFVEYDSKTFFKNSAYDFKTYVGGNPDLSAYVTPIAIHAAATALVIFAVHFFKKKENNETSTEELQKEQQFTSKTL